MSKSPHLRETSTRDLQADGLSDVLSKMGLRAELYLDGEFCGNWAVDTSGSKRIPFHLLASGTAWLHMPDGSAQTLNPGDFVVFPKDSAHILSSSPQCPNRDLLNDTKAQPPIGNEQDTCRLVCGFFEFNNRASWPLLEKLPDAVLMSAHSQDKRQQGIATAPLVDLLIQELDYGQAGHYAAINHLAYLLFLQLMRQQIATEVIPQGLLSALFDRHISLALKAIHQQPEQHWSLQTLADTALTSRSNFAKRFHQLVGIPAIEYLTAWRMQIASEDLQQSNRTILDISQRCGYESEAAFRKAFKKHTGFTPGQVRKQVS